MKKQNEFEVSENHQINKIKVWLNMPYNGWQWNVWLRGYGTIGGGYSKEEALQAAKEYIKQKGLTKEIVKSQVENMLNGKPFNI